MVLEREDEVGFHWDKDYAVEGQGVNVFPHLATVTYLTGVGRCVQWFAATAAAAAALGCWLEGGILAATPRAAGLRLQRRAAAGPA